MGQKNVQEEKTFYTDIWGRKMEHNKDATWLREIKKYEWEEQTDTSTDFSQKAEEVIQEDSELESPWTRSGPRVLAEEFYQLT